MIQDYGPVSLDSVDALTLNWNQIQWLVYTIFTTVIVIIIIIVIVIINIVVTSPKISTWSLNFVYAQGNKSLLTVTGGSFGLLVKFVNLKSSDNTVLRT